MSRAEGTVFFEAQHTDGALPQAVHGVAPALLAWRSVFARQGLIGQDPHRYDGAGFGNVSARLGPFPGARGRRPFVITGTQTGGDPCVSPASLSWVRRYQIAHNRVESMGPKRPSSESMTHGAIYDLGGHIRWVFHVHCPTIWPLARALRLPTSDPNVDYGTPKMATEIRRLAQSDRLLDRGIMAMGGHEDGVISFGRTATEAGSVLFETLASALAIQAAQGPICR